MPPLGLKHGYVNFVRHSECRRTGEFPMRTVRTLVHLGVATLLLSGTAMFADTTYDYTGQNFTAVTPPYTTLDHLTGSFTVTTPLLPNQDQQIPLANLIDLQFDDGVRTITSIEYDDLFLVGTDASDNIVKWAILMFDSRGLMSTCSPGGDPYFYIFILCSNDTIPEDWAFDNLGEAHNLRHPGTWATIPEPTCVSMLLLGITTLMSVARKSF